MNESAQIIKITYKVYVFSLVADPVWFYTFFRSSLDQQLYISLLLDQGISIARQ